MGFANQRTTRELFRGAEVVSLQHVLETCTYCDLLSAWSHKAFIFGLTHQHLSGLSSVEQCAKHG